jgi:two-component system, NtrC family, sensor kinase
MLDIPSTTNFIIITNKNGRIDYEINESALSFSEYANEGIVIGDLYGYISDVNEAIVRMFGAADKTEIVGKHILQFIVKEEKSRAIQNSLASITSDQGMSQEYRVHLMNGEEVTLEVTTTFLRDEYGEKIGFVNIIRRVS